MSTVTPQRPSWSAALKRMPGIFTVLLALGTCATGFGIYDYYSSFNIWPEEVRSDLRASIKAKNQGDSDLSLRFMRRAYDTSLTLPAAKFGSEPHLKLSGIAVAYADLLESAGRAKEAYEVYMDALQRIRYALKPEKDLPAPHFLPMPKPTNQERMRAVALASKLGIMAEIYNQPPAEEEKFLTFAVEEMLRVLKDVSNEPSSIFGKVIGVSDKTAPESKQDENKVALSDLELPSWVSKTDVGAPLAALGAFYTRRKNYDFAMPLYLHATSILIPPPPRKSPPEDRCRGAQMMLNLADVIIKASEQNKNASLHQAQSWVHKALDIVTSTRGTDATEPPRDTPLRDNEGNVHVCEEVLVATLFNLASISEMEGKFEEAKAYYSHTAVQASRTGMYEQATEAKVAVRRVERSERVQATAKPTPT